MEEMKPTAAGTPVKETKKKGKKKWIILLILLVLLIAVAALLNPIDALRYE